VIFIALYSIFIIFISFTHQIKEGTFFIIASPTAIYYLSGIAVLWIHNLLIINFWIILDLIILYIVILILEMILKKLIPAASKQEHTELNLGRL